MTNHNYPKYNAAGERERNAVGAKIAEARNAKNWNLGKLTEGLKACGVNLTKAAVNKWETGETVPNIYQFLAVTALLGMDDRLGSYREDASQELNQEGLRKLEEYRRDLVSSGNYRPAEKPKPVIQFREIAVAYMPAAAGTGNWLDDTEAYEMVSVPAQEIPKGAELGIRISGDSMEPVFHDGQISRSTGSSRRRRTCGSSTPTATAPCGGSRCSSPTTRRSTAPSSSPPTVPSGSSDGCCGHESGGRRGGMIETMDRVKELAAERGLSLYQLSVLCKVSYHTLKSVEERNGQLKLETIDKICTGLQMPLRDFFP